MKMTIIALFLALSLSGCLRTVSNLAFDTVTLPIDAAKIVVKRIPF